ncbi:chemotaxis protein CheW [Bacillus methanolicus]|uniref:Chemotaxis protein CheW n=1 Tax=Bacillus methanolicus (strain MGA3 / ATCC 53907) TaxID=796606 RepID=I3DZD3_BACMM|nr:chemotaxis protein CheW [Bacillus methanolicus]AIE59674.1 CheW protein [Bacillus methanolicus MGA3]EIJ79604.1 CheW protein [Bacillus methanolicus MGA3]
MTMAQTDDIKVIVFQLMDKEYAIPVSQVQSIEKVPPITRVPGTSSFVKGVINLRGVVTPIIDLRKRFGFPEVSYHENTRVIIVSMEDIEVGLIVDAANDVIDIPANSIEPPPEVVGGLDEDYIKGVAKIDKRLLILLDLGRVLKSDEITVSAGNEG